MKKYKLMRSKKDIKFDISQVKVFKIMVITIQHLIVLLVDNEGCGNIFFSKMSCFILPFADLFYFLLILLLHALFHLFPEILCVVIEPS